MADTLDVKYEFERWISQRGESAIYIGDGLYSLGAVCDQADAFRAGVEIGLAAALASRPAEVDDWIGVEDRMPEPETDVLVILRGKVHIGAIFIEIESYEEGGREIHYWDDPNFDGQDWAWNDVTHWKPMPLAPSHTNNNKTTGGDSIVK